MSNLGALQALADQGFKEAARLIVRGRRELAAGDTVDLRPIGPAIARLCTAVRSMPPQEARLWTEQLNTLLRALHALGAEVEAYESVRKAQPDTPEEGSQR
jgi:hypothetical protein